MTPDVEDHQRHDSKRAFCTCSELEVSLYLVCKKEATSSFHAMRSAVRQPLMSMASAEEEQR
eukprot:9239265-Alexandrium_andersonii.AAC.1